MLAASIMDAPRATIWVAVIAAIASIFGNVYQGVQTGKKDNENNTLQKQIEGLRTELTELEGNNRRLHGEIAALSTKAPLKGVPESHVRPYGESTSTHALPADTTSEAQGIPVAIDDMEISQGSTAAVPGVTIHGVSYPTAFFFVKQEITIQLHKKYKLLSGKFGIDDRSGGRGMRPVYILSQPGDLPLLKATANPNAAAVAFSVDVSNSESIEIGDPGGFNGETAAWIRWVNVVATPK